MEKIVIGLLRSQYNVKIKQSIISKIIESKTKPSVTHSSQDLLTDIELLWSIGQDPDFNSNKRCDISLIYESLLEHYDLIKLILNYYLSLEETQSTDCIIETYIQKLITHLVNLIKITFMPNLNRTNDLYKMKQTNIALLVWLRLINETYLTKLNNFEICSNFINILSILNSQLFKSDKISSISFLYFVQNDLPFCKEYLNFTKSFLILADKYFKTTNDISDLEQLKKYEKIIEYLEKSILETNILMIRNVISTKIVIDQEVNFYFVVNNNYYFYSLLYVF